MAPRHVRARMQRDGGGWLGEIPTLGAEVRARPRSACESRLRRAAGEGAPLTIEVTPDLVGVSEAAAILGWDRRRVATYLDRGAFPSPIAALASGRIWRREDVETFANDRARRRGRRIAR